MSHKHKPPSNVHPCNLSSHITWRNRLWNLGNRTATVFLVPHHLSKPAEQALPQGLLCSLFQRLESEWSWGISKLQLSGFPTLYVKYFQQSCLKSTFLLFHFYSLVASHSATLSILWRILVQGQILSFIYCKRSPHTWWLSLIAGSGAKPSGKHLAFSSCLFVWYTLTHYLQ